MMLYMRDQFKIPPIGRQNDLKIVFKYFLWLVMMVYMR